MRRLLPNLLLALLASAALADYAVLFYNNWYFAGVYWPKWLLLGLALTPAYFLLLQSPWRRLWLTLGVYWTALVGLFMLATWDYDLSKLTFTGVLNLEVPMVWLPLAAVWGYALVQIRRRALVAARGRRGTEQALRLRQRLRRNLQRRPALAFATPAGASLEAGGDMEDDTMLLHPALERAAEPRPADHAEDGDDGRTGGDPPRISLLGLLLALSLCALALLPRAARAEGIDSTSPWHRPDRHVELTDPAKRWHPDTPQLNAAFPAPLESRPGQTFYIVTVNTPGAPVRILDPDGQWHVIGKVLQAMTKVDPNGFTASGWAVPGTVCATAVNAMHIKTRHDYTTGRSTVFSILPKEFVNFDPAHYNSYYSESASVVTDIPAGSGIFGGLWAPTVGSKVYSAPAGWQWPAGWTLPAGAAPGSVPDGLAQLPESYAPAAGETLVIPVVRRKYNPEYIEFENRFGGIVWVKELGLDPYPIAQVLKPVAGAGRFGGSQYAERGRIRANHPGVICISTSDKGDIGGFQIIPRDHAMSPEMTYARTKTQWMVVGPLWAFDPSWEGLPPLFTDYLYPAWVPDSGKLADGEQVTGAKIFLSRCTVRARYSDSPTPDEYELLRETRPLSFECLATMTNLRIYFPRE
jgi:hypothetical protein